MLQGLVVFFSGDCWDRFLHRTSAPAVTLTLMGPVGRIWRHLLAVIQSVSPTASFFGAAILFLLVTLNNFQV